MNRNTFIHIGMGKAGSTSLQTYLRSHPEVTVTRPDKDPIAAFCQGHSLAELKLPAPPQRNQVEVISDERFSFFTPGRNDGKGQVSSFKWRELREAVADWLCQQRPDAKIILIKREDDQIIPSAYAHYVRDGGDLAFPSFLAVYQEMFSIMTDTDHLIDLYSDRFGSKNLIISDFETIAQSPKKFASDLSQTMQLTTTIELPEAPKNASIPFPETVSNAFQNRCPDHYPNRNWTNGDTRKLLPAIPPQYPKQLPQQTGKTLFIAPSPANPTPLLSLLYYVSKYKSDISKIVYFRENRLSEYDQRILETALWTCPEASVYLTGDASSFIDHWSTTPNDSILPDDFDPSGNDTLDAENALMAITANKTIELDCHDATQLVSDFIHNNNIPFPFALAVPSQSPDSHESDTLSKIQSWTEAQRIGIVYYPHLDQERTSIQLQPDFLLARHRGDLEIALRRQSLFTFDFDCQQNPIGLADLDSTTLPLDHNSRNRYPQYFHDTIKTIDAPSNLSSSLEKLLQLTQ